MLILNGSDLNLALIRIKLACTFRPAISTLTCRAGDINSLACRHLPCRPEMKFGSLDALIERIRTDIGLASAQLDAPEHAGFEHDPYLLC